MGGRWAESTVLLLSLTLTIMMDNRVGAWGMFAAQLLPMFVADSTMR